MPDVLSDISQLSVVVVLHNSRDTIETCLAALPHEAEVLLVDSGSSDDGLQRALRQRPDAIAIVVENRGFGAGCNRGAERASRSLLMFLNPDAVVDSGCCERLVAAIQQDAGSTIVGPLHREPGGAVVHNCRRTSCAVHEIAELLPSAQKWVPERWRRDLPAHDAIYKLGGPVAYVQGACFVISRKAFSEVGGFDERFFLYSEEELLADALAARGGSSRVVADAWISHVGGHSTAQASDLAVFHFYRSRVLFYSARDGRSLGAVFSLGVGGAALVRCATLFTRCKGVREARAQVQWLISVWRGLLSGLCASGQTRSAKD